MNPLALAVVLLATAVAADNVVDAAKAAKAKRKKSTTRVITNADVKKSKGVVVETKLPPMDVKPQPTLVEQHEAKKKAEAAQSRRLSEAERKVAALEKELAAIEQEYYDENDLRKRDEEIVRRFNDVKQKLDAARVELASVTPATAQ